MLTFFSKLSFSNNSFRDTNRVSNGLDPKSDGHFVPPDLGANCLQRLLDDKLPPARKELKH